MTNSPLRDLQRFDRPVLESVGFAGFVPLITLDPDAVPPNPGVYCVVRPSDEPPSFLAANPAGHFKARDPSVAPDRLESKWVAGTPVVYIGKASARKNRGAALRKRLDEYKRHGRGEPVGHWGGRLIWQLADASELLICWRVSADAEAEEDESALLSRFVEVHGALPFANLKRGRAGR